MAYILQGFDPRAGLRGSLGSIPGGNGTSSDPYGGIGGGTAAQLRALVTKGLTFKSLKAETGLVNGEKYVFCLGSDKKYYKFKVPGTGLGNTPSDAKAIAWFNAEVAAAKPAAASVTSPGPTVTTTIPTGTPGVNIVVGPSGPRIINGSKMTPVNLPSAGGSSTSSGTPWGLIAGGVALLAVGAVVMRRRDKRAVPAIDE